MNKFRVIVYYHDSYVIVENDINYEKAKNIRNKIKNTLGNISVEIQTSLGYKVKE